MTNQQRKHIYRGIRFAPFQRHANSDSIFVGTMACDTTMKNNVFSMAETNCNNTDSRHVGHTSGNGRVPNFLRYSVRLEGVMNDFTFSLGSTWGGE
mmetsp:Transcript_33010/g.48452  ORF Transcript_33010/g.48452 Transcript_33010/m.48452 type:complete len:96 (+) Transcript_33010:137-424(+)